MSAPARGERRVTVPAAGGAGLASPLARGECRLTVPAAGGVDLVGARAGCGRRVVMTGLGSALALACAPARAQSPAARLRIGDAVPDLTIATSRGDSVRLGSLRGRVLIVNFFASYCGPCRTELPLLRDLVTRLGSAAKAQAGSPELVLLPVGVDDRPADAARFAQSLGVTTPILVDPAGAVRTAFTPDRYPCTFLVDSGGIVRHINRGFGPGYPLRVERWLRSLLGLPPV